MNVVKEDFSENQRKLKIFYITIISICVVAIFTAIIIQVSKDSELGGSSARLPELEDLGIRDSKKLTDDKISIHKEQFNEIFDNKVKYDFDTSAYKINRINEKEEIVYLGYQNKENKVKILLLLSL